MKTARNIPLQIAKRLIRPLHSSLISHNRVHRLAQLASEFISKDVSLQGLDVGCGTGEIAWNLQRQHSDLTITGVDTLLRPNAKIHVVQSNASHLPFEDNSFDFVMLIDVLHHTDDPEQFLVECQRVAKQFVLIKDHNCNSVWDRLLLSLMDWVGNRSEGVHLPYNYLSDQQWQSLFTRLNLTPHKHLTHLSLYSPTISWIFDRDLHFMVKLSLSNEHPTADKAPLFQSR